MESPDAGPRDYDDRPNGSAAGRQGPGAWRLARLAQTGTPVKPHRVNAAAAAGSCGWMAVSPEAQARAVSMASARSALASEID